VIFGMSLSTQKCYLPNKKGLLLFQQARFQILHLDWNMLHVNNRKFYTGLGEARLHHPPLAEV